jgi:glycosyltransferase involved in cell wall biosynthesis
MSKLTIVVIGRNDISHLNRSLQTAAKQCSEVEDCNVLYADDDSTDGSVTFANAIADRVLDLDVMHIVPRRNIGGIRNAAVEYLTTKDGDRPEYIWFHDSDDYLYDGAVKRVLDVIEANNHPDCVSVPIYRLVDKDAAIPDCSVMAKTIDEAPMGPVGEWSIVFKAALYVKNPEGQMCEDCPWHYEQFDKFNTWARVEGAEPCYVWDNTNPNATTRTVDYCGSHSITLISAALDNVLIKAGKDDQWVSDNLRNIANMYDVRRRLKKNAVLEAWRRRFQTEVSNFLNGFHIH